MGAKLQEIYDKAKVKGGFSGQLKLAMITKIPLAKAKEVPDTPENIRAFELALSQI